MRSVWWCAVLCVGSIPLGGWSLAGRGDQHHSRYVVDVRDFAYQPHDLTVAVGDTVIWINRDIVPHTATSDSAAWDSDLIAAGQSWSVVAHRAGRVTYVCRYHPTMQGRLVVE